MRIVVSDRPTAAEWDCYVRTHPHATVDHLWSWKEVIEGVFRQRCVYMTARRGDVISGVLPVVLFRSLLFGRACVSLPFLNYGGLLASDEESASALIERATDAARRFGASYVELRHMSPQIPGAINRQHKLALSRPLPASTSELWETLDRKVRNQVRKGQKEGLTVAVGGSSLVAEFYDVFARNMRDLGTPVYSKRLFETTVNLFGDAARVWVVRYQNRAVAASISLRFRDTVLVPWASSLRESRHLCSNMFLYWCMLEHATDERARVFDFGRSSPGTGPHHFKLQWGAQETPMYWEYILLSATQPPDHSPSNPRFERAIKLWQQMPVWLTELVGPPIVRAIP